MIRTQAPLFALALGLCLATAAHAATSATAAARPLNAAAVRLALQGLYQKENDAAAAMNAQGTVAYVSPAFKGVDAKGAPVSYDDLMTNVTQLFTLATSVHSDTTVQSCSVAGNKATVRIDDSMTLIVQGMTLVDNSVSMDTWTKTKEGWRITASRTLNHAATVNGQPAPDM